MVNEDWYKGNPTLSEAATKKIKEIIEEEKIDILLHPSEIENFVETTVRKLVREFNENYGCQWTVDERLGVGRAGCTGQVFPLGEVEDIDYCVKCGKPLLNVDKHSDILVNEVKPTL